MDSHYRIDYRIRDEGWREHSTFFPSDGDPGVAFRDAEATLERLAEERWAFDWRLVWVSNSVLISRPRTERLSDDDLGVE